MDGPSQHKTQAQENMAALTLKDLMIMKMFLEKALRADIFLSSEKPSVTILHTKLTNLINNVATLHKEQLAKQQTQPSV